MELVLSSKKITLEDLINVTRKGYKVSISDEAYEKIDKARALVDKYVEEGKVSYGITTGFGKFAEVSISKEQTGQLQKNIVMSHSCSVGNPLPIDIAKGVVLLRAVNLAKGYSGARRIVIEKLVELKQIDNPYTKILEKKDELLKDLTRETIKEGKTEIKDIVTNIKDILEKENYDSERLEMLDFKIENTVKQVIKEEYPKLEKEKNDKEPEMEY